MPCHRGRSITQRDRCSQGNGANQAAISKLLDDILNNQEAINQLKEKADIDRKEIDDKNFIAVIIESRSFRSRCSLI